MGGRGVSEKMEIRKQTSGEDERGQCGSCWRPSLEREEDKERKIDEEHKEFREIEKESWLQPEKIREEHLRVWSPY